jgi:LPLT family lysophospholipid transporter-like MFS transporter
MKAGFYTIMAAQFFSSLADNALLIAAIRLLQELQEPEWMLPSLQQSFVVSYVILAPLVGAFADSMPKGRVMLITNAIKVPPPIRPPSTESLPSSCRRRN